MIRVLIHTDLPEPVAPAMSICGIFAISVTIVFPPISFPTANVTLDFALINSGLSKSSRKVTVFLFAFGTSIPTAAFPGIGASIRMSDAARLSLISSARRVILFTLTPCSGTSSYRVTLGPQLTSPIFTLTPKLSNVS